jgi:hypothetical protein
MALKPGLTAVAVNVTSCPSQDNSVLAAIPVIAVGIAAGGDGFAPILLIRLLIRSHT